jgi:hypothetical protein
MSLKAKMIDGRRYEMRELGGVYYIWISGLQYGKKTGKDKLKSYKTLKGVEKAWAAL